MLKILGHRGAVSADYYQNTVPAFVHALNCADGLETDAVLSADGKIFLIHSTRGKNGKVISDLNHHLKKPLLQKTIIEDLTAAQIEKLRLKNGEKIPKLTELLDVFAEYENKTLNIELKSPKCASKVCQILKKYIDNGKISTNSLIISSFDHAQLVTAAKKLPQVPRALLCTTQQEDGITIHLTPNPAKYKALTEPLLTCAQTKKIAPSYAVLPTRAANAEVFGLLKKHDLELILWTETEAADPKQAANISAAQKFGRLAAIITDEPKNSPYHTYDLAIIGAGINGAGIARDAAMRGKKVVVFDQSDFGSATSANSTKLIHGGLRYLEFFEFSLVRKALIERDNLLKIAPHITWPLRFNIPHLPHFRPSWLMRAGLFLYDNLHRSKLLKHSQCIALKNSPIGKPLDLNTNKAYAYSDGWVNDHRLVIFNLLDAQKHGAHVHSHTPVTKLNSKNSNWEVYYTSGKFKHRICANQVVNATGPWASKFLTSALPQMPAPKLRLVKGSHIVVPKLFEHNEAYLLQQPDGRIIFAIPYEEKFTLVGTTEEGFDANPKDAAISKAETEYLINAINANFTTKVAAKDIIFSYSGVRPLIESDGTATSASRDYILQLTSHNGAPILNILGGKITTYRVLAEQATNKLFPQTACQTSSTPLAGGDFSNKHQLASDIAKKYKFLPPELIERYVKSYGTIAFDILKDCRTIKDLGKNFGANLYAKEVDYLIQNEWATSAEDILFRRTKLGLHITPYQVKKLESYLAQNI